MIRSFTSLLLALLLAVPAAAQQPAAKPKPAVTAAPVRGPTVEGITEYRLGNGLRVLLFPDPSKPTTTVNITYLVGSRLEGYGESGMAHLLEHLLFKGTPRHRNIPQELTEHGARPNGTTWYDRTNYFEIFNATDANLAWALDLEADRMVHSFVAKKDLESEFTVVRNEFERGENDPGRILLERTLSAAYLWHNYGKSTIGARSDIESVPIDRLQAFYRKYYQPDNAVLLIAGKFDEKRTLSLVQQKFAPIPRPRRTGDMTIYPTYTVEPVQDGERSVSLRRVGDVQVIDAAYHVPAGSHPDFAVVDVLASVLGDEPSGRLYKALVESKKAVRVTAFDFQLKEPGVLVLSAELRREDPIDSARTTLLQTVDSVIARPPSAAEVERAKTGLLKDIDLTLNDTERVGLELSEWTAMGDWRLLFLHRDRIKQVTPEEVQRVAATYLKRSNLTLGEFLPTEKPDRSEVPPVPDVAAAVHDYRGDTAVVRGEAFDPSPANIDQRTRRSELPGGLGLALLPKRTRGQTVNVSLTLRFGRLETVRNKSVVADLAADLLLRGTKNHTRQQLNDEFDRLKARVSLAGGPTSVRVGIETTRPNLAPVLTLVGEVLREPAFDAAEFAQLKQEDLAALDEQRSDPQALGQTAFSRYLSPFPKGDPRYVATIDELTADYRSATLEDVRQFYAEFYGASQGEISVVGDFDPDEVIGQLSELLGHWPSPQPFERVPSEYHAVAATTITIPTPDKPNGYFVAGQNLAIRDNDSAYPALVLGNYMLGGGFLNSRLAVRIRQKEGISYGVRSTLTASSLDQSGRLAATAIYAPQNVQRLETAFREEIDRVLRDGFTAEEVRKAKEGYLQARQLARAQDGGLAGQLANGLYLKRTLTFDADFEQKIGALTVEQINEAMRRYLDPAAFTIVKAGDFGQPAAEPAQP
jgi:zinc protease